MRILVVGSGGREHTLAWALAAAGHRVVCGPGNPGTADVSDGNVAVDATDPGAVAALAGERAVDLVVFGPEDPLVRGGADAVRAQGIPAFGPGADGARLEGSKAWMKDVLVAAGVPTAAHATFGADDEAAALAFLETLPGLYVVKTDGLAAGKGVVVTESLAEARDAVRAYLSGAAFGDAGRTLVIEEGLAGPELSLLAVCDGTRAVALAPAQDFKRVGDGDVGPNTGGMGAYSPVPLADDGLVDLVLDRAVEPTLAHLRGLGIDYRGVLYAGVMLTADGPKVLEYNVRFGDPECQVVVPRLASDLGELLLTAAEGRVDGALSGATRRASASCWRARATRGAPHGRRDRGGRRCRAGRRRRRLPRGHPSETRRAPGDERRPGPHRGGARVRPCRGTRAGLRPGGLDLLAGAAAPDRHRGGRGGRGYGGCGRRQRARTLRVNAPSASPFMSMSRRTRPAMALASRSSSTRACMRMARSCSRRLAIARCLAFERAPAMASAQSRHNPGRLGPWGYTRQRPQQGSPHSRHGATALSNQCLVQTSTTENLRVPSCDPCCVACLALRHPVRPALHRPGGRSR